MSKYMLWDMSFLFAVGMGDVQDSMYVIFWSHFTQMKVSFPAMQYLLNPGLCNILCWFDLNFIVPPYFYQHQRDSILPFKKLVMF